MPKVLLVEDDPTMLSLLRTLMSMEGFETGSFDGEPYADLPDKVRRELPDVVLMDVNLHGADGLALLRSLRQDKDFALTPVVMSSGMDLEIECLAEGANAFILKPYMPDELINAIRKQLAL